MTKHSEAPRVSGTALPDTGIAVTSWDEKFAEHIASTSIGPGHLILSEDALLTKRMSAAYDRGAKTTARVPVSALMDRPGSPRPSLARGMVLLKNSDHVLPLRTHPRATSERDDRTLANYLRAVFREQIAIIDATKRAGPSRTDEAEKAARAASDSLYAIVIVGPKDTDPRWPPKPADLERQHAIVAKVSAAASRTIVILTTSHPHCLPWAEQVNAILVAGIDSPGTAEAVVDVLVGATEPQGRACFSYPPCGARFFDEENRCRSTWTPDYSWFYDAVSTPPLFWFGAGLGYGQIRYDLAQMAPRASHQPPAVDVSLSNAGVTDTHETIQIYFAPAELSQRVRLVGFGGITVPAGGSASLLVECDQNLFGPDQARTRNHRRHRGELLVARGLGDIRLRIPFH